MLLIILRIDLIIDASIFPPLKFQVNDLLNSNLDTRLMRILVMSIRETIAIHVHHT